MASFVLRPVATALLTLLDAELEKDTSVEELNKIFEDASKNELKGVLQYTEEPLVSIDIVGNGHSSIFDSSLTKVTDGRFVQVVAWYDNEWGYSNRMVDVIKRMG